MSRGSNTKLCGTPDWVLLNTVFPKLCKPWWTVFQCLTQQAEKIRVTFFVLIVSTKTATQLKAKFVQTIFEWKRQGRKTYQKPACCIDIALHCECTCGDIQSTCTYQTSIKAFMLWTFLLKWFESRWVVFCSCFVGKQYKAVAELISKVLRNLWDVKALFIFKGISPRGPLSVKSL